MNDLDWEIIFNSGINIAEYHILSLFNMEGSKQRESLSKYANTYFGAVYNSSSQSYNEYEKAIDSCLAKGYIKVLSREDCMRDEERWKNDDNQFCEEDKYLPGNLDFTTKGSQFYRKLDENLCQKKGITPCNIFDGFIGFKWKHKGIVSILTKKIEDLEERIKMIHQNPSHLLVDRQLIEIGKPYQIGTWWVTRFDQLSSGWRVNIKYRV